jgi:hypothetical protein
MTEILEKRGRYCIYENGRWIKFNSLAEAEEYVGVEEEECQMTYDEEPTQEDWIE